MMNAVAFLSTLRRRPVCLSLLLWTAMAGVCTGLWAEEVTFHHLNLVETPANTQILIESERLIPYQIVHQDASRVEVEFDGVVPPKQVEADFTHAANVHQVQARKLEDGKLKLIITGEKMTPPMVAFTVRSGSAALPATKSTLDEEVAELAEFSGIALDDGDGVKEPPMAPPSASASPPTPQLMATQVPAQAAPLSGFRSTLSGLVHRILPNATPAQELPFLVALGLLSGMTLLVGILGVRWLQRKSQEHEMDDPLAVLHTFKQQKLHFPELQQQQPTPATLSTLPSTPIPERLTPPRRRSMPEVQPTESALRAQAAAAYGNAQSAPPLPAPPGTKPAPDKQRPLSGLTQIAKERARRRQEDVASTTQVAPRQQPVQRQPRQPAPQLPTGRVPEVIDDVPRPAAAAPVGLNRRSLSQTPPQASRNLPLADLLLAADGTRAFIPPQITPEERAQLVRRRQRPRTATRPPLDDQWTNPPNQEAMTLAEQTQLLMDYLSAGQPEPAPAPQPPAVRPAPRRLPVTGTPLPVAPPAQPAPAETPLERAQQLKALLRKR